MRKYELRLFLAKFKHQEQPYYRSGNTEGSVDLGGKAGCLEFLTMTGPDRTPVVAPSMILNGFLMQGTFVFRTLDTYRRMKLCSTYFLCGRSHEESV